MAFNFFGRISTLFCFCSKSMVLNKIRIKEENRGSDYTVAINDDKIYTTVADTSDDTLNHWLKKMHKLHTNEKNDNLLVSLSAGKLESDCSMGYNRYSSKEIINMLKFGVGSYCLLLEISSSGRKCDKDSEEALPPFKGFISSNKITFVGFDVDDIMDKLNKEHKLRVAKTLDLKKLHLDAFLGYDSVFGILVKLVFGDELDKKKCTKLRWSKSEKIKYWEKEGNLKCIPVYSHDNVKVSTVEAYLCHLVAVKCNEAIEDRRRALLSGVY